MGDPFRFPPLHPLEAWNQMMSQVNPWGNSQLHSSFPNPMNNHLHSSGQSSYFKRPSCYVWINPSEEQKMYRKNVCRKFYSGGICPYGEKCSFLHVEPGSLQHSSGDYNASSSRTNHVCWKTKLCYKWSTSGKCPYGDLCTHAHGDAELRNRGMNYCRVDGNIVAAAPSNASSSLTDDILPKVKRAPISLPQPSSQITTLTLEKCKRIYGDWIDD